jgi:hypothetical protein
MDLAQVLCFGVGAVLIVLGIISRLRKEKSYLRLLLPGGFIFLLGAFILAG